MGATTETASVTAEDLAQMLRRRRHAMDLSQEAAAERMGVSLGVLKRYESPSATMRGVARWASALDALGVELRFRERK